MTSLLLEKDRRKMTKTNMEKEKIKIKWITNNGGTALGLGEDDKVYFWDGYKQEWKIYKM